MRFLYFLSKDFMTKLSEIRDFHKKGEPVSLFRFMRRVIAIDNRALFLTVKIYVLSRSLFY